MLATGRITQIPTDNPTVYAFRIEGGVQSDEINAMARTMDDAMDRHERISMLLVLHDFDASDAASSITLKTLATQVRSAAHVERYAVVGAPDFARRMIGIFDDVTSIEARTFDPGEEAAAWAFVGARPAT